MSHNVDRLKALLFDDETQALGQLSRRIDQVADLDATSRRELEARLQEIFDRVGTGEKLTGSVAEVLSEALRKAEVTGHSQLAGSIAPLVVTTIKAELRNSQDEMVEALYPITGRLVKAYVASAMKDLSDEINRRFEQNPVMLRLQSVMTGRSVGEVALASGRNFEIREVYLIRRGTGELLACWPQAAQTGREHAMSGVLAAINEFANEAFAADQTSLRQIDLGDEEVYLRGSPQYLLAARCAGVAPKGFEQSIDDAFINAVERQHEILQQPGDAGHAASLSAAAIAELGTKLQSEAGAQAATQSRGGGTGLLKGLAALILLPLVAWYAYSTYSAYATDRVRAKAEQVLAGIPQMRGYPVKLDAGPRGAHLTVSGLAPSADVKTEALRALTASLSGTRIEDRLSTLPASQGPAAPDLTPDIAALRKQVADASNVRADIAKRDADAAVVSIGAAASDLSRAAAATVDARLKGPLSTLATAVAELKPEVEHARDAVKAQQPNLADATTASVSKTAERVRVRAEELARLITPAEAAAAAKAAALPAPASVGGAAERLLAETSRLSTLATGAAMAAALAAKTPVAGPALSERDRLLSWSRANAVFFGNADEYRNAQAARHTLEDLAGLLRASPITVRIVGYTDEAGGAARNTTVAMQRAERVRADLVSLGVNAGQLLAVGRADANDISAVRGPNSPNRRVEFELAFDGEAAQ